MCRSVLRVGWGRDQGLGAVPVEISIPYGLYGRACGFSVGLVLIVKVECKGLPEGKEVGRVTPGCTCAGRSGEVSERACLGACPVRPARGCCCARPWHVSDRQWLLTM